jgi:hypothetical protein
VEYCAEVVRGGRSQTREEYTAQEQLDNWDGSAELWLLQEIARDYSVRLRLRDPATLSEIGAINENGDLLV